MDAVMLLGVCFYFLFASKQEQFPTYELKYAGELYKV